MIRNSSAALSLILTLAALSPVTAQQYTISTVAGGGGSPLLTTPARGLDFPVGAIANLAADAAGNVYFALTFNIFKLDRNGIVTRVAGTSNAGFSGDGGPATNAQLSAPFGLTVDSAGDLFFVDGARIRRIAPSGTIVTVAGNGTQANSGDGGPAFNAQLRFPYAIAVDRAGNLFITGDNSVRKVSAGGVITTIAGNGTAGFSGDGGPAVSAQLSEPAGLAVDSAGNLYIADADNIRIRKVSADGIISTVAGNGQTGFSGDGGPATDATFAYPQSIAVDSSGNLYIADCEYDSGNARIRKVSVSGTITTVAGNGNPGFSGDGGSATAAQLSGSEAVAVDGDGNIFIADSYNLRVRKVSTDGIINTVAGTNTSSPIPFVGDGVPATSVTLAQPKGVAVDAAGNLFIEDGALHKVSPDGIIHTVANVNGYALAEDPAGNLAIAGDRIYRLSSSGTLATVVSRPANGIASDAAGNLFAGYGGLVSKISPTGVVTTVAGGGMNIPGDGGPPTAAQLNNVTGVLVDGSGNLLFSETYSHRVRKVSPDGIITTVAGNGGEGFSGDGGPATSAELNGPDGLAMDSAGNLYIADVYNNRIRLVTTDGIITTIAGSGSSSFGGSPDGGSAVSANLNLPYSVALDPQGNIYVADTFNRAVRVLRPTHSSILIGIVVDAASQRPGPVSPGKIVVIYGAGLGPKQLVQNQPSNGLISTQAGSTTVSFNGIAAPVLYASATQVAAVVPYAISGATAQVTVSYQGQASPSFSVPVAAVAPGIFTSNQTGAGQIAAVNAVDGSINSAVNPVKVGAYITLFATGEGQTAPAGVDGKVNSSTPPAPVLPVTVTVSGIRASVQYAGEAPGQIAGLMQINVQIPSGVQPGGYVPVVLKVGDASTTPDAVWVAVSSGKEGQ